MTEAVDYVERARSLASLIESSALDIEIQKTVTPNVSDAIAASGIPWMMAPASVGGGEQGAVALIEVLEELSRADGSTGWSVMANSAAIGAASAFLSDEGLELLFGGEDKAVLAGQLAPMGTAVEVEGGYVVTGKYQFGSGSTAANWMGVGFLIMDDGKPRLGDDGAPAQWIGWVPKTGVEMLGNWDVTGLVGTGSYDYSVHEQFVPHELTFLRTSLTPARPQPSYALGLAALAVCGHAAVVLGLARRALEEAARITDGKKRVGYPVTIDKYPVFLQGFAEADAKYHSARCYLIQVYADAESVVAAGGRLTDAHRARMRQASTWAHNIATEVVDFCRLWSGTPAFRNPSNLGRVIRDMGVATQHALIDQVTLIDAGVAISEEWRNRTGS